MGAVVGKFNVAVEARLQSGIRVDERLHFVRISGKDHDEPLSVIFHAFEECRNRLAPIILLTALDEGIRFVYEENAVKCRIDDRVCFHRRLPDVFPDQARSVRLDQMALLHNAHFMVDLGQDTRNRRLSRARIPRKDTMV